MAVKDYDPRQVSIYLGGHTASGFADGTFVSISRNNPMFAVVSGASGEEVRSKSNDTTGTIELTVMQTSETNDYLTAKMLSDEGPLAAGKFSFMLIDGTGRTLVLATECWVEQPPTVEYGKEVGERTWRLVAGDLRFTVGGTGDLQTEVEPNTEEAQEQAEEI